ncbi:MAG: hypothetical protein RBU37_28415 [Myxococcota bacterium]|jgi:GNAT superfamily N-acetyltransferase|nr:hypothetical protein [Myxococcota bacterium]
MNPLDASQLIQVTADNVSKTGFFCYMSKKKSEGYQRKLQWLEARFAEGLRIKMLQLPERGFIEYIPGEHAWRAVHADGYLFIHCLWVVGKSKGKGHAAALLESCMQDAERMGLRGVAMVCSEKVWMCSRRILEKHGFTCVDTAQELGRTGQAPNRQKVEETGQVPNRQKVEETGQVPNRQKVEETGQVPNRQKVEETGQVPNRQKVFSLMVKHTPEAQSAASALPLPRFAGGWEEKARLCGEGLTVLRSEQCPYIVDATQTAVDTAAKLGVRCQVVDLQSRDELMQRSPSPYGVFGLVHNGELLSYHYLLEKELLPLLSQAREL